ncbi:hypothetical protein ACFL3T_00280 [Patescibacteria group bacterium]
MDATSFLKSKFFQLRLYGVLTIILLIILGYYTFTNVMTLFEVRAEITTNESFTGSLNSTNQRIENELSTVKKDNKDLTQTIHNQLDLVLPEGEELTALTRNLESFASEIHRLKNPFMINNLQFTKVKGSTEELSYEVLPFKMTIQSSYDNFFKFLKFVENSGTLSDETRLLDIQSIIINFVAPTGSEANTSGKDEINFNVSMNAYYRSTKT